MMMTLREAPKELIELIAEHSGDWDAAREVTARRLLSDEGLLSRHLKSIVEGYVRWLVLLSMGHHKRRSVIRRLRKMKVKRVFDWPLSGGVRLGEANRSQLLENARWYRQMERTCRARAAWLEKLAALLDDDAQTLGSVVSEEDAAALLVAEEAVA